MCLLHSCMASASSAVTLQSVLQDSLDPEYQRMNKERSQAAAAKNRTLQVLACCYTREYCMPCRRPSALRAAPCNHDWPSVMDVVSLMPGNGLGPCITADRPLIYGLSQPHAVQRSLFMHLSSTIGACRSSSRQRRWRRAGQWRQQWPEGRRFPSAARSASFPSLMLEGYRSGLSICIAPL